MKPARRHLPALALALLVPVLALTAGHHGPAVVSQDTSLHRAPGGAAAGFVSSGTDVEVLEERDGWLRVRMEGWLPASAVDLGPTAAATEEGAAGAAVVAGDDEDATPAAGHDDAAPTASGSSAPAAATAGAATGAAVATTPAAAAPTPAPAAAAPAPAPAPAPAGAIEGLVSLKTGRRKAKPAAGLAVYLLDGAPGPELTTYDDDAARQISELNAEAADLKRRADRAMSTESLSIATRQHDDLMAQRRVVLEELLALQAAEHGKHAAVAVAAARATASTDAGGWYTFGSLPAGTYTVYARLTGEDLDVEWVEQVQVAGGVVNAPLDGVNVRGMPQ